MLRNLPPVTRNLFIITFLCWLADAVLGKYGINSAQIFGLHYITASDFRLWQPITYIFMHANFSHIFCNMFAVLMFAPALEDKWGSRRFLIYYLVTGVGAALVQEAVWALQLQPVLSALDPTVARQVANRVITIGASGAVFGILFAFAWLFPNIRMFILFIPIPIRARVLVILYALVELFAGFSSLPGDNVAHFAHLGGMVFGWLLILWWRHQHYAGFEKADLDDDGLRQWFQRMRHRLQAWLQARFPQLFTNRHRRIRRNKNKNKNKDNHNGYNDFHYHESV